MVRHALDWGYAVVGVCREAQCGEARCLQGAHHCHSGRHEQPRRHQARRSLVRRGARRARSNGSPPVRVGNGPGGPRLCASGCAARNLRAGGTSRATVGNSTRGRSKLLVNVVGGLARLARVVDLDDQVEACRRVFASDTRWTVVRGSSPSRRARAKACQCGAGTWATPSSKATSRVAWTLPSSWWRPSRTTSSSRRPRRLSAARRPLRSRMRLADTSEAEPDHVGVRNGASYTLSTVLGPGRHRVYQAALRSAALDSGRA